MSENPSNKSFISYSDKLKDPRWQKKRLQVMERDNWKCQRCGDEKSTLHVHHKYYCENKDPWTYGDLSLITLCESCHAKEHNIEIEKDALSMFQTTVRNIYSIGDQTIDRDLLISIIAENYPVLKGKVNLLPYIPNYQTSNNAISKKHKKQND